MDPKALARVKRADRIAEWIIRCGGILVVCAVIGILFVVLNVALPLFFPASIEPHAEIKAADLPSDEVLAVGIGEYLETAYVIDESGTVTLYELPGGAPLNEVPVSKPDGADRAVRVTQMGNLGDHAIGWNNGAATLLRVSVKPSFDDEGTRSLVRDVKELAVLDPLQAEQPTMLAGSVVEDESGSSIEATTRVELADSGALTVGQVRVSTGFLNPGEKTTSTETIEDVTQGDVTAIALSTDGEDLYVGSSEGYLGRWDLSEAGTAKRLNHFKIDDAGITNLALIFGDISIAVSDESGSLSTWFPVATENNGERDLREIHVFPNQSSGVSAILPARHNKSFFTIDGEGGVRGWHMTSERLLLEVPSSTETTLAGLAVRGNGLVTIEADGDLAAWIIDAPHPETSVGTLFGPVWYENYPGPDLTWQSSSSSDDFEPKMSLVPLIFGSFKGTVYAMIFAVPLALFGAVYTSQFAANSVSGTIKAAIEIMAAIPSVVIGFLAALWFAPILDEIVLSVLTSFLVFPIVIVLFVAVWHPFRETDLAKFVGRGFEFVVAFPVLLAAGAVSLLVGHYAEGLFFDDNFKQWLFDSTGEVYDQRNSIVIAFALGFAVVPLIFTIAEDAISNVPFGLRAASLALGASRWQTVWRVVLPSASPGIFAAMIIGFGRAVGETMIVLMATGNTPILDVSPFNGMRTLSANIAVEIPEAPVDGTLYRVLFMSAVLLLILTSVLNTAAELIRQRLRKKYGQFH